MTTSAADIQGAAPTRIDGYAPIREYAVIGNKRTAALVALDGSIDWLALTRFDGPSVFGAILDSRAGGCFSLAPSVPYTASRRYRPATNVLETTFTTADGSVRVTDAMSRPAARVVPWNELVRRIDGLSGTVPMAWSVEPRFGDEGEERGRATRRHGVPMVIAGRHVIAVQSFGAGEADQGDGFVRGRFEAQAGHVAVLGLSAFDGEPVTLASRDELLDHLESTAERWQRWSEGCRYDGPWRDAVLRSALALDLLVDEGSGAICAAATMGLPERVGGPRNFDYRYGWLRDMNLSLEAMLRLGYREQVHASLRWMLAATRRTHPRLRPMYRLDGTPQLPARQLELPGYRNSRPVTLGNPAQSQQQLGNFGDLFNMTFNYVRDGNALDPEAARQLATTADFVCAVWRSADSSIWELGDKHDYTQSKLACWLALDRAATLAEEGEIDPGAADWRAGANEIRAYVHDRCWSSSLRAYARYAGTDELDAAVLLATRGSFVDDEPERLSSTIDAVRRELGAGGPLLYRYSGMQDEEGAFLACSFWLVEALARVGRHDEGAELMDALVDLTNDVGLLSEEIDPGSHELLGNLPQALSHLSLVNAAARYEGEAAADA